MVSWTDSRWNDQWFLLLHHYAAGRSLRGICSCHSHDDFFFSIQKNSSIMSIYFGCGPLTVTVTIRIITFSVGNPYKPSFPTVTVRGPHPIYTVYFFQTCGPHLKSVHQAFQKREGMPHWSTAIWVGFPQVTNYRFRKSMGWEIKASLLYQAYALASDKISHNAGIGMGMEKTTSQKYPSVLREIHSVFFWNMAGWTNSSKIQ